MSKTETTPKTSVLTDAMERAKAKLTTEVIDEQGTTIEKKITRKQIIIGVGATVASAAAIITALKLFTGQKIEDETSEEISTED